MLTETAIREFFGLSESADLDKPRADLGFASYREAAEAHFEKWGDPFAYLAEKCRREFNRQYHEDLLACYRSGQMSEQQWQAHVAAGEVKS